MRVISGKIAFDVAVDFRVRGKSNLVSGKCCFVRREPQAVLCPLAALPTWFLGTRDGVLLQCDDIYHPGDEGGIMWNDPELCVEWPAFLGEKTLVILQRLFFPTKIRFIRSLHLRSEKALAS